jgi:hypothetical protein
LDGASSATAVEPANITIIDNTNNTNNINNTNNTNIFTRSSILLRRALFCSVIMATAISPHNT